MIDKADLAARAWQMRHDGNTLEEIRDALGLDSCEQVVALLVEDDVSPDQAAHYVG